MNILRERTYEDQIRVLAGYLRDDPLHQGKNRPDSLIYKILAGLAYEFLRERGLINYVANDYNPENTVDLLEDWERTVGIPDGCLINTGTLEERRLNVLLKLAGTNVTTAKGFEKVAEILGFSSVIVESGVESGRLVLPLTLPFILAPVGSAAFSMVVRIPSIYKTSTLPFTLPFILGSGKVSILKCFFEKLKPSNTVIYYIHV